MMIILYLMVGHGTEFVANRTIHIEVSGKDHSKDHMRGRGGGRGEMVDGERDVVDDMWVVYFFPQLYDVVVID